MIKYEEGYLFEDRLWIFLEYMDAGCLTELLDEGLYYHFSEKIIRYIIHEILKALDYIHKKRIAHRDIKSDNIMLTT